MMKIDKTVARETRYIALWVICLSLIMQAVFLIIGEWECTEQAYEVSFDGDTESDSESYGSEEYVWEFDDDENLTIYWDGEREGKYDYNVSGKKLYTELIDDWFGGDADYFTIKKLTDTKLILEIEFEDYDEEIIYTFYFDRIK